MHSVKLSIGSVAASLIVAGVAQWGASAALAEEKYPDRPIRLIVPFSPGGQTDNVSRRIGDAVSPILGQQIVIDNRAGAAGTIGSAEAARAKPDGYTILMATTSTHAINPTMMSRIQYDAIDDFAPVIVIATGPMTISVHPSVPVRTLMQLVSDIKARPGFYSYGGAGVGSVNHLAGELFKAKAGNLQIVYVPYKGAGPAVIDLMGGQIPMASTSLSSVLPHHRSGRVRTLAVMKEGRSVGAPDIPTAVEGGLPGAVAYTFNIIFAPAGTPRVAIDTLANALRKVMANHAFLDTLVKIGVDPVTDSSPEKAATMLRAELAKWRPLILSLGLKN
ncbi:MAG TPA: tripartite tricarboxylate transporter substrate binding protein [Burkholderiales bacterium]|nr:tripartite tricarboxylate transporter substrate binding protein [Burkholderiales bacterium]